jgi:ABC-2 type transport system permease protein
VLLTGIFVFGVPFRGNLGLYYLASALFLLGALGTGLLISMLSKNQQVATMVAFLSSVLPAFLLSGFIFPISNMPVTLQMISYLVPAKYFLHIIRGVFLKDATLAELWPDFLAMCVFASVFLFVSISRFRKRL